MKKHHHIMLSDEVRAKLDLIARKTTEEFRFRLRANIILLSADGVGNRAIANSLSCCKQTVNKWRKKFSRISFNSVICTIETEQFNEVVEMTSTGTDSSFEAFIDPSTSEVINGMVKKKRQGIGLEPLVRRFLMP
jgi:transposase-like protein